MMRTGANVLDQASWIKRLGSSRRSVVAAHRALMMAVITGHGRTCTVAHTVMPRVAVAGARTNPISVAGVGAPGMVPVRVVAVDHRTFDVGGAVIAMIGGIGVAAAIIAIIIRATAIGIPAGYRAFLIGRIRREVAGTGIGRALVDVIILLHRID